MIQLLQLSLGLFFLFFVPSVEGASHLSTGAGNGFRHAVNEGFDFHIAYPPKWSFSESRTWTFENKEIVEDPARRSSIVVSFIVDFPAEDLDELLLEIQRRHPDPDPGNPDFRWQEIEGKGMSGFTTGDIMTEEQRAHALDYYLIDNRVVIYMQRQMDVEGQGFQDVRRIVDSIDRASTPPQLTSVISDKEEYSLGETACLLLFMDDLRGSFTKSGLKEISIVGLRDHWSPKKVSWEAELGAYKVCYPLTAGYPTNGLTIKSLEIVNERTQAVSCSSFNQGADLRCSGQEDYQVRQGPGIILNESPDREGPRFAAVRLDRDRGLITVRFQDPDDVWVGRIKTNHGVEHLLFPEAIAGDGFELSLRELAVGGWNDITEILVFDRYGNPSRLTSHPGCDSKAKKNVRSPKRSTNYLYVDSEGRCSLSDIETVSFLYEHMESQR